MALAVDRQEMALIRKAAKRTQMAVSEYIRETVLREAADDVRQEAQRAVS